jgi:hypothetical protein
MKALKVLIILVLSLGSSSVFAQSVDRKNLRDAMAQAFYNGCIQGFMVTYENGWYKRPEGETAESMFAQIKAQCKKAAISYRKELE